MPIYEFHCESCDKDFEALVARVGADAPCPADPKHRVVKQMSASAVRGGDGASYDYEAPPACPPGTGGCGRCM